jgi:hypothetical protein
MQIPGAVQSAAAAGLIVFLMGVIEYLQADVSLMWAPVAVAGLGAIVKAVEVWRAQNTDAIRSIQQPRSGLKRFLLG